MKNHLRRSFVIFVGMTFATIAIAQQDARNDGTAQTAGAQIGTSNQDDKGVAQQVTTGDFDGPVYQIGGSVHPPVAIHTPDPKFADEASRNKFSGNVVVALIVDANGNPKNVHVLRGMGMGLDEKAVQAVQQYKFKPATKDGKPVAVYVNVAVNFQSF